MIQQCALNVNHSLDYRTRYVLAKLELDSKGGAVVRALTPMWPGFYSGLVLNAIEFVASFRLTPRVFSWFSDFSLSIITNISKFQFNQVRGPTWKPAKADVASSLNIVICFNKFLIDFGCLNWPISQTRKLLPSMNHNHRKIMLIKK